MRLREVLVVLIDEAKVGHWDSARAAWVHNPEECATCAAAIGAQTALTINFVDLAPGDKVRIGGEDNHAFGVVERVHMVVDVRMGQATVHGIQAYAGNPVGRFSSDGLTRVG